MAKETENILQGTKGYQSIPEVATDEEVLSLENSDVVTDRTSTSTTTTSKRKISRLLVGFAALLFVGAAGFLRHGEMGSQEANLVRSTWTAEVESTGLLLASSAADVDPTFESTDLYLVEPPFHLYDVLPPVTQSHCANILIPPLPDNATEPEVLNACSPNKKTAATAVIDIIAEITSDALGSKEALAVALGALGVSVNPAVVGMGILFVLAKAAYDAICEANGQSGTELLIKDVERIAKYQVASHLKQRDLARLESYAIDLRLLQTDRGAYLEQVEELAKNYFTLAIEGSTIGVPSVSYVTNSAIASDLLLFSAKESAEDENNKICCQHLIDRIVMQREGLKAIGDNLRTAFEEYKAISLDQSRWKPERRKPWLCGNIFLGGYTNQHVVYALGADGSHIASAWSPGRNSLRCYSNEWHIQQARAALEPKVRQFFDNLERELFTPEITAFYEGLDDEINWECNGEPYTPISAEEQIMALTDSISG